MAPVVVTTRRQAERAIVLYDRAMVAQGGSPGALWFEELLEPGAFACMDWEARTIIVLFQDSTVLDVGRVWWVKVIGGPTDGWAGIIRLTKAYFVAVGEGAIPLYYPVPDDDRGELIDTNTRDLLTSDQIVVRGRKWRRHKAETPEPTGTRR